jgi:hypothetical protein
MRGMAPAPRGVAQEFGLFFITPAVFLVSRNGVRSASGVVQRIVVHDARSPPNRSPCVTSNLAACNSESLAAPLANGVPGSRVHSERGCYRRRAHASRLLAVELRDACRECNVFSRGPVLKLIF